MKDEDFAERCGVMERRYQDLLNIRVDSVRADIDDIKKKIAEHKRVHDDSVRGLSDQNMKLRQFIEERRSASDDIELLESRNERLRRHIVRHEPALEGFLSPEFSVRIIEKHVFEVQAGEFIARLKRQRDEISCEFLSVPESMRKDRNCAFVKEGTILFDITELRHFQKRIWKHL